MRFGAPPVPKQANGNQKTTGNHKGEAEFGPADTTVLGLQAYVDAVSDEGSELSSEEASQAHGDVIDAGDAG